MSVENLKYYALLTSNSDLQNEIKELTSQMSTLNPNSDEYKYDELQLEREKVELQVRQENPSLDPLSQAGNDALQKILEQNGKYSSLEAQISLELRAAEAKGENVSQWGIPWDFTKAVEISG